MSDKPGPDDGPQPTQPLASPSPDGAPAATPGDSTSHDAAGTPARQAAEQAEATSDPQSTTRAESPGAASQAAGGHGGPPVPPQAPPAQPARPRRTVSLLVAALVGAGLLVAGGVAGYFIGDAGDRRPGHSRFEHIRGGMPDGVRPDFRPGDPRPPFGRGPWREHAPPTTTTPGPTTSPSPTA